MRERKIISPGGIRRECEGQIVCALVPHPSGEKNREDIRRTDGTISLGEVGEGLSNHLESP